MRLPTWDELAKEDEQLDVLEHPLDQSLFVVGPPGSGKTVLAVQRTRMVTEASRSVAVVTYNRMLRRLFDLLNDSDVDACTMQSFVWRDYSERTGKVPPRRRHDRYAYWWQPMIQRLQSEGVSPDRCHLVVDEGQDLPKDFFRYVRHVSQTMTVFADDDQALSDQRTTLEQIKEAAGLSDPVILRRNHRNTPEIARLAEHFHSGRLPVAEVRRSSSGELPRLIRSTHIGTTAKRVSNWYRNYGGSIGVVVNRNRTASVLCDELRRCMPESSRVDIYSHEHRNEDSINVLADGVTVLNKESVKGQEFDTVFILELERFIPCVSDAARRAMYMMCARARDNLFLVHGADELSTEAAEALPGPDILERP